MTAFLDSSALVKLYADEPHAPLVRDIAVIVVSALARVEVPAAIWRKTRLGELEAAAGRVLVDEFETDWHGAAGVEARFTAVVVTAEILEAAARLTGVHGLRAYDAVQLATSMAARSVAPELRIFAAFDAELRRGAAAEEFTLLPP